MISALWTSVACFCRFSSSGVFCSLASIARLTRSRISAAAAFVNVTTSILSISTGGSSTHILFTILSTSTAVLPEPAAAETSISLSLKSITFFCSLVHSTLMTCLHTHFCVQAPLSVCAFCQAHHPFCHRYMFCLQSPAALNHACI